LINFFPVDPLVNLFQRQLDLNRFQAKRLIQSGENLQFPLLAADPPKIFYLHPILVNQYIFCKAIQCPIGVEFIAAVILGGGFGENFDDDLGVGDGVGYLLNFT
jgi:hypothetical protein